MLGALSNPKVMFAMSESAPLPVVMRRVSNATTTAKEVERLLVATPVDADSAWMKAFAASPADATAILEGLKITAGYTGGQKPVKVLPSEAWAKLLTAVKSEEKTTPNLLTLVSPDIGSSYIKILEKKKEVAELKGKKAAENTAIDAAKTDAEKAEHKAAKDKLSEQIDKASDEVDPLVKKFLDDTKAASAKVDAAVRDQVGPTLVNLRKAVDDATTSNGAALLRYPFALPELSDTNKLMAVVGDLVADSIEKDTGKRPVMEGFQPTVTLDGLKPKIGLNGLSQEDLGKIEMDKLLSNVTKGTINWMGDVATLLPRAEVAGALLSFEADTIDAITSGFTSAGWKAPAAMAIPEVQSTPKAPKK